MKHWTHGYGCEKRHFWRWSARLCQWWARVIR